MQKIFTVLLVLGAQNAFGRLRKKFSIKNFNKILNYFTINSAPFIKPCRKNEPNIANCIMKTIYQLKPVLISGTFGPGFDTIPSIEPFYVPR